jgi:hypothetical protein
MLLKSTLDRSEYFQRAIGSWCPFSTQINLASAHSKKTTGFPVAQEEGEMLPAI